MMCFSHAETGVEQDRYGGVKNPSFAPGQFFRLEKDGPRWWLVTPDGGAFLSIGACVINSVGDQDRVTQKQPYRDNIVQKYGSVDGWKDVTRGRLKEWGVTTLGGWSSEELRDTVPFAIEMSLSSGLWSNRTIPDFFSPAAEEHIRKNAERAKAQAGNPYLIGYFTDNELPWTRDWRFGPYIFPGYVAMPPDAPGKQRLMAFFQDRYKSLDEFRQVWQSDAPSWEAVATVTELEALDSVRAQADREAFVLEVARRYFKLTTEAIRANDPNHLILGCRFVWVLAPKPAVQACGEYCDIVSINYYEPGGMGDICLWLSSGGSMRISTDLTFKAFHEITGRPLLITEFGFRGMDSGMPNTFPPPLLIQPTVPTQKIRADKFEQCATTWISQPYFLGYHWFQYMDEPKNGRFDGEDGNYGLVNITDDPYTEFVERFKATNARAWALHREAR
jgi:hypothetical protein